MVWVKKRKINRIRSYKPRNQSMTGKHSYYRFIEKKKDHTAFKKKGDWKRDQNYIDNCMKFVPEI